MQAAEEAAEESDEEIIRLKQRIRLRRTQKQEEKRRTLWRNMALLSDGKTDSEYCVVIIAIMCSVFGVQLSVLFGYVGVLIGLKFP